MIQSNIRKAVAIGIGCVMISSGSAWAMPKRVLLNEVPLNIERGIQADSNAIYKNKGIGIQVNGRWLQLDAEPFIENNRTLIPIRGVMEELGAKVEWNAAEKRVEVYTDDIRIELIIGRDTAKVIKNHNEISNEQILKLDVPSKIVSDRTFIPGRFVAETLGAKVEWNDTLRGMIIETEKRKDSIRIERPITFEIVKDKGIEESELLSKWYQDKFKIKGVHMLTSGEWCYVLASAGEKSTGGYEIKIDSITEVVPGSAYVYATVSSPGKNAFVTQALTYPNVLVRFHKGNIEEIQGDLADIQSETPPATQGDMGASLKEMGEEISSDSIKEMKLYSLMQEEIKTFTAGEIKVLIDHLNTSPTYHGAYNEMLAGNNIKIMLENEESIQLTSFGSPNHVILSRQAAGLYKTYCIVSPEIGNILLDKIDKENF